MSALSSVRVGLCLVCIVAAAFAQSGYDAARTRAALPPQIPSAVTMRSFDLGLHAAVASVRWLEVRAELPFLPNGAEYFLKALGLVNDLDPRFSTPYAFSVLALPEVRGYPDRLQAALRIGERGLIEADPDWRIPFYMGAIYQLGLQDRANTLKYFDLAGATPNAPDYIRRFTKNYGLQPNALEATKTTWTALYLSSPDPAVRDRAAAHIAQIEILQYLNAAIATFRERQHADPADLSQLVNAGIIPAIPKDPFGNVYRIYQNGTVSVAP